MVTFIVEAVLFCFLFTVLVMAMVKKNPLDSIYDLPQPIIDRAIERGLIKPDGNQKRNFLITKSVKSVFLSVVLALVMVFINRTDTFWEAALTSYGLWFIVAWWDALVIDCLWFCHTQIGIIPGTDDLVDSYRDYWFHIRMSLIGCVLGIPVGLLTGGIASLLNMVI